MEGIFPPTRPDLIMVTAGAMVRAQVTVSPRGGCTDLLMNTFGVVREVRRVPLTAR